MPSDASTPFDVLALLDALMDVDIIVVGGVAATLHGGPRLTFDLDIVPAQTDANLALLYECLQTLSATVREPGRRGIPISLDLLRASRDFPRGGQLRLRTRQGPLDVLWRLHDGRGYTELYANSQLMTDDERRVRVIGLDDLIAAKEDAGRPQDREDLRYLTRIRSKTGRR